MQRMLCALAGLLCAAYGHAEPVRTDARATLRYNTIVISSALQGYTPEPVTPTDATAPVNVPVPPQGGRNPFSGSTSAPVPHPVATVQPHALAPPRNPFSGTPGVAAAPSAVSRVTGPGPVIPPEPTVWLAQTGSTLKSTLKNWTTLYRCRGKDWFIFWPTPVDYPIDAPLQFSGDFRAALNGIFSLYKKADKPLYATVNPQQCVIQVSDRRGG